MGYWLELGISGFRVDAVPFVHRDHGGRRAGAGPVPRPARLPARAARRSSAAAPATASCWARCNLPHKDQQKFFGGSDGDELTMQFDFIGMQNLYLSLARRTRARWRAP